MKKYFPILAFLFPTLLATAQSSERLNLSDFSLKGKVKTVTELQYRTKKDGKIDSAAFEEVTYSFNEKGMLEQEESKNNGSKYYQYDKTGQATIMIFEGVNSFSLNYVYEQKGTTLWQYCYYRSGHGAEIGTLQHKYRFTKDNSNRLVEYGQYYATGSDFYFKEVYTYNSNNRLEEIKNYGLSGKLAHRHTYKYDKNNNLVEEKEYSYTHKDNELNSTVKFEYKYDDENNWREMFKKVGRRKTISKEYIKTVRFTEYYEEAN